MTCMPIWTGSNLAQLGADVYLYDQNQSVLPHILDGLGSPGLGPVHTSEFAYVFGNLSHYEIEGLDLVVTEEDRRLVREQSRSWAAFAWGLGPSGGKGNLEGWGKAFQFGVAGSAGGVEGEDQTSRARIYVVGGAEEGLAATTEQEKGGGGWSDWEGRGDAGGLVINEALLMQMLGERCAFLNSEQVIKQLQF